MSIQQPIQKLVFEPPTGPAVIVTYRLETSSATPEKMAAEIAVGQTLGTWDDAQAVGLDSYLARVLSVTQVTEAPAHTLIRIAYPLKTVHSDIGTLLTVLFGKISMAGKLRLVDIDIPPELAGENFQGPRFGIEGIREKVGVTNPEHPLLMSIFKPCLGLSAGQLGAMFYHQAMAGVNLVKDDEILSDPDWTGARRRLQACLVAGEKAKRETGKTTLYAINLTGPADEILERARTLVSDGATALLFNYISYGLPMLAALRKDPKINIPLVAHPALAGSFYGSPAHGISPQVMFGRLPRLAGADLVLFPSPYGSVALPLEETMAIKTALTEPHPTFKTALPVPSAGIKAEMVSRILEDFGPDVAINAGTGIHDFPGGSEEGVKAFRNEINRACPGYLAQHALNS